MKVKDGVHADSLQSEVIIGLNVFEAVYRLFFPLRNIIITSTNEGRHDGTIGYDGNRQPPSDSLHYLNLAADVRANDIERGAAIAIVAVAKRLLDRDFDIMAHGVGANFHFHIEYDPQPRGMQ